MLTREPEIRHRVESSVEDLDEVLRMLRDTIFDLGPHQKGRRFCKEILELGGQLSPAPEVSFTGTVAPGTSSELLAILRDALSLIGATLRPSRASSPVMRR